MNCVQLSSAAEPSWTQSGGFNSVWFNLFDWVRWDWKSSSNIGGCSIWFHGVQGYWCFSYKWNQTWLSHQRQHLPGYDIVRKDSKNNGINIGGICSYIRSAINFKFLLTSGRVTVNALLLKLNDPNPSHSLCSLGTDHLSYPLTFSVLKCFFCDTDIFVQSAWWISNTYGYLYQIWKDRWIVVTLNFFVVFRAPFVYQLHANTPISWRSLLDSRCTNLQVVNWRTNYFSFRRSLQKNTRTFYFVSIAFFFIETFSGKSP